MRARLVEPSTEQILSYCADDPVERVFLEDVARRESGRFAALENGDSGLRALCHLGTNVVPSGSGCSAFAEVAARVSPRMLIGEQGAVTELWDAARRRLPRAREDRLGGEGDGFKIAMQTLDFTRPGTAVGAVGVAQAAYELAVDYAKERVQFGMPIAMNQGVSFLVADMRRPAVRDAHALALDQVLEAEPGTADLGAAHADRQDVVEHRGPLVLEVDAGRQRLDAAVADRLVAAGERREVGDAGHFQPDDERRMVGDSLGVGLREADSDRMLEGVSVHPGRDIPRP